MVRRLIAGVVIAVGLFSIAIGVQRWFDAHAAESAVHALMAAIESGDRAAVLALLTPDRRSLVDVPLSREDPTNAWRKQRGISYQIRGVQISGDRAVARVTVEKDGYILQPTVHLRRGETSRWKVDWVENLEVDPQYLKDRRAYQRQQGERLAGKLRGAFEGRPGVTVDRVTIPNAPGREGR